MDSKPGLLEDKIIHDDYNKLLKDNNKLKNENKENKGNNNDLNN